MQLGQLPAWPPLFASELESLAWAPLSDDEYLAALALLDTGRAVSPRAPTNEHGPQVHALLLLRDDLRPLLAR